jgi:hypothetical protein
MSNRFLPIFCEDGEPDVTNSPISFSSSCVTQVDVCCFDKTGTLTADEMRFEGLVERCQPAPDADFPPRAIAAADMSTTAPLVLAGCQSLVRVDGGLVGDPVERASLEGVGYARPRLPSVGVFLCARMACPCPPAACVVIVIGGESRGARTAEGFQNGRTGFLLASSTHLQLFRLPRLGLLTGGRTEGRTSCMVRITRR